MLSPEVSTAAENNERDEEDRIGHIVRPHVLPDEALHLPNEGEHGHSGQRHRQLQGQHQEHLGWEPAQSLAQRGPCSPSPSLFRPPSG